MWLYKTYRINRISDHLLCLLALAAYIHFEDADFLSSLHRIIDDQNRKEYKGKTNLAQSALGSLLWPLYRPGSTHRPHMYPTPGWAWGMGVVGGCARAVPSQPPP